VTARVEGIDGLHRGWGNLDCGSRQFGTRCCGNRCSEAYQRRTRGAGKKPGYHLQKPLKALFAVTTQQRAHGFKISLDFPICTIPHLNRCSARLPRLGGGTPIPSRVGRSHTNEERAE
jgi:hypothetical protein